MPPKRLQITFGDEAYEQASDDSAALLALIAALALEDVKELQNHRAGDGTAISADEELALRLYAEEASALDTFAQDVVMAQSLEKAMETDAGLLEELARLEEMARRDREFAIALSQGRMPQPAQPQRNANASRVVVATRERPVTAAQSPSTRSALTLVEGTGDPDTRALVEMSAQTSETASKSRERQTCVICRDDIDGPVIRAPCGDTYDLDCLVSLYRAATVDESLFPPSCCRQPFNFQEVRAYMDSQLVKLVDKKAIEFGTKNRVFASFPATRFYPIALTATTTTTAATMAAAAAIVVPAQPNTIEPPSARPEDAAAVQTDAPSPPQQPGKGKGLRALRERLPLRRAFSTKLKHASLSSPTLLSPVALGADTDDDDPASPTAKKSMHARLIVIERFLNVKLSTRRGTKDATTAIQESIVQEEVIAVDLDSAPSSSSASSRTDTEQVLPAIVEAEANASDVTASTEGPDAEPTQPSTGGPDPEPLPLARKIQSLLSSLPPFLTPLPPSTPDDGPSETPKQNPDSGADPSTTPVIDDSRLISLLSSPAMMNGSLSRGRESVWALLDNLRLKSIVSPSSPPGTDSGSQASASEVSAEAAVEDDDSIMFYGPLIPDATSEVELARSEIVSVDENGTIVDVLLDDAPLPDAPQAKARFGGIWPFSGGAPSKSASPSTPATTEPKVLVEKRVWVPSTTKLSLQVMWWGFRLWLPPPVMNLLNDKEIEAAKLGAMLTTALQWLLSNVPESALPATLRPALALVRSLVPYLGYIGGFVAWSWGAIRGFDIGNGVTLTATWLLPIALIPGTWENSDVPQQPGSGEPSSGSGASSPAPGDPSTLPSGSSPSAPSTNPPASGGDSSTPASEPASPPPGATPAPPPTASPLASTSPGT
ncbi:hypothetical protein ACG7TL_000778 [Trametes sanguinea]